MGRKNDNGVFQILVTGFEAFHEKYSINPSFEIAKSLPAFIEASDTCPVPIRIVVHQEAIPVVYDDVRELIPRLLSQYANNVHMVLHIGMASGNKHYEIEESAHRDDYTQHKDLNNKTPPRDQSKTFPDCPRNISPSLAYEKLWHDWHDHVLGDDSALTAGDLRRSDDAGHFLCDYIYLNSLVWYGRKNDCMLGGTTLTRPVMFLHVPGESDSKSLQTGQKVALGLIKAMSVQYAAAHK